MSRYPAALIALLALAGCKSAEGLPERAPAVVRVPVDRYVPVPDTLTRPCPVAELPDRSVASVVEAANARKFALDDCNRRMDAIRKLGDP